MATKEKAAATAEARRLKQHAQFSIYRISTEDSERESLCGRLIEKFHSVHGEGMISTHVDSRSVQWFEEKIARPEQTQAKKAEKAMQDREDKARAAYNKAQQVTVSQIENVGTAAEDAGTTAGSVVEMRAR